MVTMGTRKHVASRGSAVKAMLSCQSLPIIIINKVLIKVTLNKVIAGALYTVSG